MKKVRLNKNLIGVLAAISCEILFGFSYLFTKNASKVARPFALLGWRFILAFFLFSLLIGLGFLKINLRGKSLRPLLFIGLFSPCLYFIGETIGIGYTTSSESGVFLALIPLGALIGSSLILKKKPSKKQIIGIATSFFGVLITIFALGASSSLSLVGYGFLLLAVISYALYSVYVEKADQYSGLEISYLMVLLGAGAFGLIALAEAFYYGELVDLFLLPFRENTFLIAILYQSLACSIFAFFLSNLAIANIGVNRASSFIGIATVVSILAGAFILKESFSIYQTLGAIIIIAGVYVANNNQDKMA